MIKANRKTNIIFITLNIFVPLFIGMLLYLYLRPDAMITIICKHLFQISPENQLSRSLYSISLNNIIVKTIRNHLADGLWAYASTMLLAITTVFLEKNIYRTFWICVLLDCFMEVSQVINPFFTFDFIDLLCELLFTLLAWCIFSRFSNKFRKEVNPR